MLIRRVVKESGASGSELARDAGLSPQTLHMWMTGRRTPTPESLVQLAGGLDARRDALSRQIDRLAELAQELRQEAKGDSDG